MNDKQILLKLNEHYVLCKIRYYKHTRAADRYKSWYTNITIPIIILSSMTTVLAGFNGNFLNKIFAITVAIFSGLTTIGQALASFLEYNTKYEAHLLSATKYINLSRTIETEFYSNYYIDSDTPKSQFIKDILAKIQKELNMIQESSPIIPLAIDKINGDDIKYGAIDINKDLFVNPIFASSLPLFNPQNDHIHAPQNDHIHAPQNDHKHAPQNADKHADNKYEIPIMINDTL